MIAAMKTLTLRPGSRGWVALALLAFAAGCSSRPAPQSVVSANYAAESPLVRESETLSPQAHAEAERLRKLAEKLHSEGKDEEAAVVAEEALAAYQLAITTGRGVRAQLRKESSLAAVKKAEEELAALEARQRAALAEADAYELQARVALDTEPLKDVDKVSPERALARQRAALQLTSEARVLCLGAELLDAKKRDQLAPLFVEVDQLQKDLSMGSVKADLYLRATKARSGCLRVLTEIRRPESRKAPEAGFNDRLLHALTETNRLLAFRDDRGVVVNVKTPAGPLSAEVKEVLGLLGGTARQNPEFPVLVVVHTARAHQEKSGDDIGKQVREALLAAGAAQVTVHLAGHAEPVVDRRVAGADGENARVEIVFVSPRL